METEQHKTNGVKEHKDGYTQQKYERNIMFSCDSYPRNDSKKNVYLFSCGSFTNKEILCK